MSFYNAIIYVLTITFQFQFVSPKALYDQLNYYPVNFRFIPDESFPL